MTQRTSEEVMREEFEAEWIRDNPNVAHDAWLARYPDGDYRNASIREIWKYCKLGQKTLASRVPVTLLHSTVLGLRHEGLKASADEIDEFLAAIRNLQ